MSFAGPWIVHTPSLLALCRSVLAMHIVVLNEDVAVQVVLVFAKVEVSHLKGNEFSTAKTGSKSRQEQRIVLGANLAGRIKKSLHFFNC